MVKIIKTGGVRCFHIFLSLSLIFICITLASASADSEKIDPFTYASRATGVPVDLLVAISFVESGHNPYALNVNGKGVFPSTINEAYQILSKTSEHVDIGHMQIHYNSWGHILKISKVDLLDPYINAWAGAIILRYNLTRYPFWEAIGRYHTGEKRDEGSVENERQVAYAWKVYFVLINLPVKR
jgi:soluble lytic murein transglycosylase-like protein